MSQSSPILGKKGKSCSSGKIGTLPPCREAAGKADGVQTSRLSTDYTWTLEVSHKGIGSGDTGSLL